MNGSTSAHLEANITGQANRLRSIAADHQNGRAAIAHAPNVVAAESATRGIFADVRSNVREAQHAFSRGWGLTHLRSRVHAEDTRAAAVDVCEGRRPALESLPALTVAQSPSNGETLSRRRSRAA